MKQWSYIAVLIVLLALFGCKKQGKDATQKAPQAKKGQKGTVKKDTNKKSKKDKLGLELVEFKPLKGVIAVVNGEEVPADALNKRMMRITQGGTRKLPKRRLLQVEKSALNAVIDEVLIEQEAKKQGIKVSDDEVKKELEAFKARFPSPQRFDDFLKKARMSLDDVLTWVKHKLILQKLLEKNGSLKINEEEAKKVYENNIAFYTEPARIHAQDIFIALPKNAPKDQAEEVAKKVKAIEEALAKGEKFEELVTKYSEDKNTKSHGGDMGWIREGTLPKTLEKVAFALKPGEFTKKAVRTGRGYYFIKVLEKKPKVVHAFNEVKDKIVDSLKHRKVFIERMKLLKQIRSKAKIDIKLKFDEEK